MDDLASTRKATGKKYYKTIPVIELDVFITQKLLKVSEIIEIPDAIKTNYCIHVQTSDTRHVQYGPPMPRY